MLKHFSYLAEVLNGLYKGDYSRLWDEAHLSGGRASGKTQAVCDMVAQAMAVALKTDKKIAIILMRLGASDVRELNVTINESLTNLGIREFLNFSYNQHKPIYKFIKGIPNPSLITIRPLQTNRLNKTPMKGLQAFNNFDMVIRIIEEIDEITLNDKLAVDAAIRGSGVKKELGIYLSNPDQGFNNWYIKHINSLNPFRLDIMKAKNQQFELKKFGNSKVLLHYSNFKLNNFLSDDYIKKMDVLRKLNPQRAKAWYYGVPSEPVNVIFTDELLKVATANVLPFTIRDFTAGLDLGYANNPHGHPTAFSLWGLSVDETKAIKINELFYSNATMEYMAPLDISKMIIERCALLFKKYTALQNLGLVVKVDYGAGGLVVIDQLNKLVEQYIRERPLAYYLDGLKFVPVDKTLYFIRDRVDFMVGAISCGNIKFRFKDLPNTKEQYAKMVYLEPTGSLADQKVRIMDANDDSFDSDCYALMDKMKNIVESIPEGRFIFKQTNRIWNDENENYANNEKLEHPRNYKTLY